MSPRDSTVSNRLVDWRNMEMATRRVSLFNFATAFVAFISSPVVAQSCFQTISVIDDRVLDSANLDVTLQDLTGRTCGSVEAERSAIFVEQLSGISEDTFRSYKNWSMARENVASELRDMRERLRQARIEGASAEAWNRIKVLSVNTIAAGVTVAGCLGTTFTGVSAYLCVGGLAVTGVGTFDGLSSTDFQARSREIEHFVMKLENVLVEQEALGEAIMNEAQQAYLLRFEVLCRVVMTECQ